MEELRTNYLLDACSRASILELYEMYKASLSLGSVGVAMRQTIESGVEELVSLLSYPEYLTDFHQVVEFWKGMEKLDRMVVNNGLLLFTSSQRIPLKKSLFFQLLKHRKDIRGVRVVFSVGKQEKEHKSSFCCIDEGDGILTTLMKRECVFHNKCNISVAMGRTVFRSGYSDTPWEIDEFFDENAEVPTMLESNGYRIYIGSCNEERDPVNILEAIKEGRKGFVNFSGFDENGDYSYTRTRTEPCYPFKVCSIEDDKAELTVISVEYGKNKHSAVTNYSYCFSLSSILREDLPEGLKLSFLAFWAHKNMIPYFPYIIVPSDQESRFQYSGDAECPHCCYFLEDHSIFLYSCEKVEKDRLKFTNNLEYKLGREYKLDEGYGYEL